MKPASPVQLVAVVGGSGAGKSWLVARLCGLLGDKARHLHLDDFYRDRSHLPPRRRATLNFDTPAAIDWDAAERVLRACRAGEPVPVPRYDFTTHARLPEGTVFQPRPIVFVDGLWLLRRPAIRRLFDLRIYIDTPETERCRRRLARDVVERGRTVTATARMLRTTVVPMHRRHVEPQRRWADLVLRSPFDETGLAALADRLWALLTAAELVPLSFHAAFRAELLARLQAPPPPPSPALPPLQRASLP